MLDNLKEEVLHANQLLKEYNLVKFTWGNVSGLDKNRELMVIKPSGVDYDKLTKESMVVVDLSGKVVEGKFKPSSDTATHLELYKAFEDIHGITHTHSKWATIWAQAGKNIPALGTTHADYFSGEIFCTRKMSSQEIENNYEKNTGKLIVEEFKKNNFKNKPAILVRSHGPFVWDDNPIESVKMSVVLEEVAQMAYFTLLINQDIQSIDNKLLGKHFFKKHGENSSYGQE